MHTFIASDQQFVFKLVNQQNKEIAYQNWLDEFPNSIVFISLLKEQVDNGGAYLRNDYECVMDLENIYNLSKTDYYGLNLPEIFPYQLFISAKGILNQSDFLFGVDFYDFIPHGNKLKYIKNGPLITFQEKEWMLSSKHYQLLDEINSYNALPDKNIDSNMRTFARIKKLAINKSVVFDTYLTNETVFLPTCIKLNLNGDSSQLEILPSVDQELDLNFQKKLALFPKIKSVYPISTDNGRVRLLFDKPQQEQLQAIKKNRVIRDKDQIRKIIENPTSVFDPDVVDVSEFYSDRVIKIGLYEPKFYPFVSPYKSEWLPGVSIDMMSDGVKDILVHNESDLEELHVGITECEETASKMVRYKEDELPLNAAKSLYSLAQDQLNKISPISEFEGNKLKQKRVLIIEDNAESLNYSVDTIHLEKELLHQFHSVSNLVPMIELKDHQKEGIAWLQNLYEGKYAGALLADDMGLGKTLQILYFIEWISSIKNNEKPILVVAPISLLENWEEEYARFFQPASLPVYNLYGKNYFNKRGIDQMMIEELSKKQLVFTNYEPFGITS